MNNQAKIEAYTRKLSRSLRGMSDADRSSIVEEIASHLEYRAEEGRLDEAIASLGEPAACARSFRDEQRIQAAFDGGNPATTIWTLMSLTATRGIAVIGLVFSGIFFVTSLGFLLTVLLEFVMPDKIGLWVAADDGFMFVFGMTTLDNDSKRELLGAWYIPVTFGLSVLTFLAGQQIGKFFLGLMKRKPVLPAAV